MGVYNFMIGRGMSYPFRQEPNGSGFV